MPPSIQNLKALSRYLAWLFSVFIFTKNGNKNVFGLISENILSENEIRKQLENENNKFSFSLFLVENRNLILVKMKMIVVLSKYKNTKRQ